jgi:hypothetical protein
MLAFFPADTYLRDLVRPNWVIKVVFRVCAPPKFTIDRSLKMGSLIHKAFSRLQASPLASSRQVASLRDTRDLPNPVLNRVYA